MIHLGDLAESVARQLATEVSAPVEEATAITEEAVFSNRLLSSKMRFSWRPEDRVTIDQIRIAADRVFGEAFGDMIKVVDEFFLQLRVPQHREGVVVVGADGRYVWETDAKGNPIERWSQLTGQDVEQSIANLCRLRMQVAPMVNQLMLEALYARTVASDFHDDAWGTVMGTQGDKEAKSNRENRVDRYHAFFRFWIYSVSDTFLKEINAFIKQLENIRYWQVRTQK